MCPEWINELLNSLKCRRCKKQFVKSEIVAIGVEYRVDADSHRVPYVFLNIHCSRCEHQFHICQTHTLRDVMNAITACHIHLFKGPMKFGEESADTGSDIPSISVSDRLQFPPTTPMSDAKVRAFVNRLQRTSFKRTTKGYRAWMKDLGVDIDKKVSGADDVPY